MTAKILNIMFLGMIPMAFTPWGIPYATITIISMTIYNNLIA